MLPPSVTASVPPDHVVPPVAGCWRPAAEPPRRAPRPRDPDDPRLGPVWLRRELAGQGLTDRELARLRETGQMVQPRRGAYVDGDTWRRLDASGRHGLVTRAVLKSACSDAVVSHISAIPEYDGPLWGLDTDVVTVTRRDGKAGRREAGVCQHLGHLDDHEVLELNGIRVVDPTRAAIDVATVTSTEVALGVVNHLLHEGLTTLDELWKRYEPRRGWPSALRTGIVLGLARAQLENVGETRCWYLFHRQGLPAPIPQVEVFDEDGTLLGRLDFAWPDLKVFVEFDGRTKYEKYLRPGQRPGDAVWEEKLREQEICRVTGWRVLRLTWDDLRHPARVAAKLRALMGLAR